MLIYNNETNATTDLPTFSSILGQVQSPKQRRTICLGNKIFTKPLPQWFSLPTTEKVPSINELFCFQLSH